MPDDKRDEEAPDVTTLPAPDEDLKDQVDAAIERHDAERNQ